MFRGVVNADDANNGNLPVAEEAAEEAAEPAAGNEEAEEAEEEDETYRILFRSMSTLTRILPQTDPLRMGLTTEEYMRALNIRAMVESVADLDNLSHLMYVQLALVCRDNLEDAKNRCYAMQHFREAYNIRDTLEEGYRLMQWWVRLFPRQILHFSFSESEGAYIFVHDLAEIDPSEITSALMTEDIYRAMYYCWLAFLPDIESMRKGIISVAECANATMKRGVFKLFKTFNTEFLFQYPFIGKCRCYHTSAMVNVMVSMLRKLLPENMRDDFVVGLELEGHMGDTFLAPSVEESNIRTILRLQLALKLRYESEGWYSLDEEEE